jgi:hypothetical protein
MLQELVARTDASTWAIASMLFFIGVYAVIAVRVVRARPEDMDAQARLALDGDGDRAADALSGSGGRA